MKYVLITLQSRIEFNFYMLLSLACWGHKYASSIHCVMKWPSSTSDPNERRACFEGLQLT